MGLGITARRQVVFELRFVSGRARASQAAGNRPLKSRQVQVGTCQPNHTNCPNFLNRLHDDDRGRRVDEYLKAFEGVHICLTGRELLP